MRTRANKTIFASLAISLAMLLTLAGCGGGSSSPTMTTAPAPTSPGAPPPPPPTPPMPPPPTPTPPPVPVGTPTEFLYASVGQKGGIDGFKIDLSNGHLTAIAGSPFAVSVNGHPALTCTVGCSQTLTNDPLGKFLFDAFIGQSAGAVSFKVDANSGALTQADFKTPAAETLSTDPQGRFLYGNNTTPAVVAYDIDRNNGTLSPAPGMPYSYPPQADVNTAPAASASFAYTLTRCSGTTGCGSDLTSHINGFSIDQNTGALTPLPNSPFAGGQLMQGLAMHPTGKFLYSEEQYMNGNVFDMEIVGFQVNADGSLIRLSSPAQQTPDPGVSQLVVSPNGAFLYHTANGTLRAYAIDQTTGALSLTGTFTTFGAIAIDPSVKFVFSTGATIQGGQAIAQNSINVFSVDPNTGKVTAIPADTMTTTDTPTSLAVDKTQ